EKMQVARPVIMSEQPDLPVVDEERVEMMMVGLRFARRMRRVGGRWKLGYPSLPDTAVVYGDHVVERASHPQPLVEARDLMNVAQRKWRFQRLAQAQIAIDEQDAGALLLARR